MTHFAENLKKLRKQHSVTQAQLGKELKVGRTTIINYESGFSEPDLSTVVLLAKRFGVSTDELLTSGMLEKSKKTDITPRSAGGENSNKGMEGSQTPTEKQGFVTPIVTPTVTPTAKKSVKKPDYNLGTPHIITVNNSGIDNIIHVPVKARAGYLSGYADPDFIDTLPTYQLPGFTHRTYRSFEIEGMSMTPTLKNRDWVVAEWVEKMEDIRDGRLYVVVSKTEGVVVKRLLNRLSERGKLYLKSDNITNRQDYPTIEMAPEDVLEVWYARVYFSTDFSEPNEVYKRLNDTEIAILELQKQMAALSGK